MVAASVVVRDGTIVSVGSVDDHPGGARVVDMTDDEVLIPGLVDTHVHVNEPGRTEWEGFASATRAAAAGGVTTIVDMPLNSIPPTVDAEALRVKRKAADGQCFVDVGFWGGAVPGNEGELRVLHDAGVFGFKCFLAPSGVDEFGHLGPGELAAALAELRAYDALMIVHAEDADAIAAAPAPSGTSYAGFVGSRPPAAEDTAIAQVIELARTTGARVHVLHLSSADALPMIAAARADGVRLTVETCPHYLAFTAEEIPDGATQFKCCPPIRDAANRELLWLALRDGVIDCVVSDHSPCTPGLKWLDLGDFGLAWGGIASLHVALPAVWTQARSRGYGIGDVTRWMAAHPAELAGLGRKGAIAIGRDADLVVFAPDETFVVDPTRLYHRNPVTPYAGRQLTGVVRQTWLRGEPVDFDEPHGRLLTRDDA
ncbi:MAG: allB [Pseudonocardia sp.]|nr:allB [Pseudonocardia sp.]